MRFSDSNAGYTMFRGSVKSTGYPLHSPVCPSLPLPCVAVCHHISTGLYHELRAARPSFRSWQFLRQSANFPRPVAPPTPSIAQGYATESVPAAPHIMYPTARRHTVDDIILKILGLYISSAVLHKTVTRLLGHQLQPTIQPSSDIYNVQNCTKKPHNSLYVNVGYRSQCYCNSFIEHWMFIFNVHGSVHRNNILVHNSN